jgi:hypothetical protein
MATRRVLRRAALFARATPLKQALTGAYKFALVMPVSCRFNRPQSSAWTNTCLKATSIAGSSRCCAAPSGLLAEPLANAIEKTTGSRRLRPPLAFEARSLPWWKRFATRSAHQVIAPAYWPSSRRDALRSAIKAAKLRSAPVKQHSLRVRKLPLHQPKSGQCFRHKVSLQPSVTSAPLSASIGTKLVMTQVEWSSPDRPPQVKARRNLS